MSARCAPEPATGGPDGAIQRVRVAAYAWAERDDALLLVRIAPGGARGRSLDAPRAAGSRSARTRRRASCVSCARRPGSTGRGRRAARRPVRDPRAGRDRRAAIGSRPSASSTGLTITGGELRHEVDESTDLAAWIPFAELDALPSVPLRRLGPWPRRPLMHSTIGIDIAAPPDLVYRRGPRRHALGAAAPPLLALGRRPRGAGRRRASATSSPAGPFVPLLGLGLPVTWRSRTWHEPATRRLRFVHVAGATKGMDVTWTIEPVVLDDGRDGTRIEIAHDFAPAIPGFAAVRGPGLHPADRRAARSPRSRRSPKRSHEETSEPCRATNT